METGLGDVHTAALAALAAVAPRRAAALTESVTIDLDTTDVEVYGRHKRGVAYNHQGQRVGRPHVATWADTATVLAADLLAGNEDPRRDAPELLHRALAALPAAARAGRIRLRADAGYFAGQLARAALFTDIEFAIGARRIAPLWRLLDGLTEADWTDAIDMAGAQVAVADYCPNWWPAATRLLIRRVRLDVTAGQVGGLPCPVAPRPFVFPADWLTPGANRAQEDRCAGVGKRDMSSPISAMTVQAAVAPTPGISSRRSTTLANGAINSLDAGLEGGDVGAGLVDAGQHLGQQDAWCSPKCPVNASPSCGILAASGCGPAAPAPAGRVPRRSARPASPARTPRRCREATEDSLIWASSRSFSTRFFSAVRARPG